MDLDKVSWHAVELLCKANNILKCREERKVYILSRVNAESVLESKRKRAKSVHNEECTHMTLWKKKMSLWFQRFYSSCWPTQWWAQNNYCNMWRYRRHPFKIKPRSTSSGNQDCCTFNFLLWPKGVARWQCEAAKKRKIYSDSSESVEGQSFWAM